MRFVPRSNLKPDRLVRQAEALEKRAGDAAALRAELETAFLDIEGITDALRRRRPTK